MRYSEKLIDKIDHIRGVHESWKSPVLFDDVVKWILQFNTEDYDLAIRIIEHIDFLNFGDVKIIVNSLFPLEIVPCLGEEYSFVLLNKI